jgi:hypothetical protein
MTTPRKFSMSAEGKALLMKLRGSSLMHSPLMFDVLKTLEHDMHEAANGGSVSISEWTEWLKKGETQRSAFMHAFIVLIAMSGMTSRDVAKLRRELMNVTPSRRRRPRLIHGPAERETRSLM